MKKLEKFLVTLAALSLLLFYAEHKKAAGLPIIALGLLSAYYLLGSFFLFSGSRQGGAAGIVYSIVAGATLSYGVASLLMFSTNAMTSSALLLNNGLFSGLLLLGSGIDFLVSRRKLSDEILVRVLPLLVIILWLGFFG